MALAIGQTTEIQGSGSKPYIIKNCGDDIYSCTCPGWRNCKGPVNTKTCKHLKIVNGAQIEAARIAANSGVASANASIIAQHQALHNQFVNNQALHNQFVSTVHPAVTVVPNGSKQQIIDAQEATLGRKLRQDEKTNLFGPKLLLAQGWDGVTDPTGYFISTKYDGIRAFFDGTKLISRQGNEFQAPAWFISGLGNTPIEGELFLGRSRFQETTTAIHGGDEGWKRITFLVIDAPKTSGTFEQRMAWLKTQTFGPFVQLIQHTVCTGIAHLKSELLAEEARGGEGLMLRQAGSAYIPGRNSTLLKVKSFFDAECEITGFKDGKNAFKGMVGAFNCVIPETVTLQIGGKSCILKKGITFDVGSGLTVAQRQNPPPVGSLITFRFLELTKDGIPRNGSLVAIRNYE